LFDQLVNYLIDYFATTQVLILDQHCTIGLL